MRRGLQQGESCIDGEQSACIDVSTSDGGSTSGSNAWKSSLSGQGLLHRQGDGTSDSGTSSGSTAWSDGLHSEHGGSTGSRSYEWRYRVVDDGGDGSGRADDAGIDEKACFAPIESECPGGVCPVPWATSTADFIELDPVDHPSHYTDGSIECIEAIEAQLSEEEYRGYLKGNIVKYLWREKHKGGIESLKKAEWYLKRLIETDG